MYKEQLFFSPFLSRFGDAEELKLSTQVLECRRIFLKRLRKDGAALVFAVARAPRNPNIKRTFKSSFSLLTKMLGKT